MLRRPVISPGCGGHFFYRVTTSKKYVITRHVDERKEGRGKFYALICCDADTGFYDVTWNFSTLCKQDIFRALCFDSIFIIYISIKSTIFFPLPENRSITSKTEKQCIYSRNKFSNKNHSQLTSIGNGAPLKRFISRWNEPQNTNCFSTNCVSAAISPMVCNSRTITVRNFHPSIESRETPVRVSNSKTWDRVNRYNGELGSWVT